MARPSSVSRSSAVGARLPTAGNAVKAAVQSNVVRNTVEDQLTQLINQQFAKVRAMRYARETDAMAAQVQFADGPQRWVVFREGVPIGSFPGYDGDLEDALRFHNHERLKMRAPRDLAVEIAQDRDARRKRWKVWARDSGVHNEEVVEELLLLEAGGDEDTDG